MVALIRSSNLAALKFNLLIPLPIKGMSNKSELEEMVLFCKFIYINTVNLVLTIDVIVLHHFLMCVPRLAIRETMEMHHPSR